MKKQLPESPDRAGVLSVTFGLFIILITGAWLFCGYEKVLKDEQTRTIGLYGLSWSWFLTLILLFGLFRLDYFRFFEPETGSILVFLIIFMGMSAERFQYYLFRREDVE